MKTQPGNECRASAGVLLAAGILALGANQALASVWTNTAGRTNTWSVSANWDAAYPNGYFGGGCFSIGVGNVQGLAGADRCVL